jgi:hypothetical protein
LNFNATDPNKRIFSDVKVYDSILVFTKERVEKDSIHADYLMTLQQFLSTSSFNNSPNNEILLEDKHYILQDAKYIPSPQQQNGHDCPLFGLGTLLHAIEDLPTDDMIFGQEDITFYICNILHPNRKKSPLPYYCRSLLFIFTFHPMSEFYFPPSSAHTWEYPHNHRPTWYPYTLNKRCKQRYDLILENISILAQPSFQPANTCVPSISVRSKPAEPIKLSGNKRKNMT